MQAVDAERRERSAPALGRQRFLRALIADEQVAAPVREAEIVDRQHAQTEADLGADRIERRVERLLGDGEVGDAAPARRGCGSRRRAQRRLRRQDLERAAARLRGVRQQFVALVG